MKGFFFGKYMWMPEGSKNESFSRKNILAVMLEFVTNQPYFQVLGKFAACLMGKNKIFETKEINDSDLILLNSWAQVKKIDYS